MSDDNRDQLPPHNRSPFAKLVVDGLGYCCPYAFLRCNKRTGAIATRLGVTDRTVRLWKAKFKAKEIRCQERGSACLLDLIKRMGK